MCPPRRSSRNFPLPSALLALLLVLACPCTVANSALLLADNRLRHVRNQRYHRLSVPCFRPRQRLNRKYLAALSSVRSFRLRHSVRPSATVQKTGHLPIHTTAVSNSATSDASLPLTEDEQSVNVTRATPTNLIPEKGNASLLTQKKPASEPQPNSLLNFTNQPTVANESTNLHISDLRDEPLSMTNMTQLQILRNEFRFEGGVIEFIEWLFVFLLIAPGTFPAISCILLACATAWRRRLASARPALPHMADQAASPEPRPAHTGPLTQRFTENGQSYLRRSKTSEDMSITRKSSA